MALNGSILDRTSHGIGFDVSQVSQENRRDSVNFDDHLNSYFNVKEFEVQQIKWITVDVFSRLIKQMSIDVNMCVLSNERRELVIPINFAHDVIRNQTANIILNDS